MPWTPPFAPAGDLCSMGTTWLLLFSQKSIMVPTLHCPGGPSTQGAFPQDLSQLPGKAHPGPAACGDLETLCSAA